MKEYFKRLKSIHWYEVLFFSIPILWILGIHVADVSRVILVLAVMALLTKEKWAYEDFALTDKKYVFMCFFVIFYLILLPLYQISKVYVGTQGIDFAIFSQAIHSVYRFGQPSISLITEDWVNFLGHHFSPFLYFPGVLGYLGIPSYLSGPLVHSVGLIVMAIGLFFLAQTLKFSKSISILIVSLILANPSIRNTVFWGIHDETFALPFITLAFLFREQGRHWSCFFALLATALTKESMFLFNICFVIMTIVLNFHFLKNKEELRKHFMPYALIAFLSAVGFFSYFFLQPILIGKNFDHFDKLGSMEDLFSFDVLRDKFKWLVFLFLPVIGIPLLRLRSFIYLLPAVPFVSIVFVSSFSEMHKLLNYYAAVPSLIISIASIYAISILLKEKNIKCLSKGFALLAMALAFSFASSKPSKDFIKNLGSQQRSSDQLRGIPSKAKIVATSSASLFLFRCEKLQRLWLANKTNPDFDYIVIRADEDHLIEDSLRNKSNLCAENSLWKVRCHSLLPKSQTKSLL